MNKPKAILCSCFAISTLAFAQHDHGHGAPSADMRVAVEYPPAMKEYPPAMKEHTLTSMRDHLLAINQIQEAMGNIELCVLEEFFLRFFNADKKNGKKWFFTPEMAIYHKLYQVFV